VDKTQLSELCDTIMVLAARGSEQPPFSDEFLAARQAFIALSLKTDGDITRIAQTVRRVIETTKRTQLSAWWEHCSRQIPNLIREFATYLPNDLEYTIPGGKVRMENGFLHRQHAIGLADDHFIRKVGLIRQAIDLDHHRALTQRFEQLPAIYARVFADTCYMCGAMGHTGQQCPEAENLLAGRLELLDDSHYEKSRPSSSTKPDYENSEIGESICIWDNLQEDASENKEEDIPPPIQFQHVRARQEYNHFAALASRWRQASLTGTYAGTTPDPTKSDTENAIAGWPSPLFDAPVEPESEVSQL
jgi:hypothetical protein